ncbi:MAG: hypothetical protein LBK73_04435 [Treponema sp.]|nr:hypothetical protein [Treponema sp.]
MILAGSPLYSDESATKAIALRGLFSPHNKADFGLKSADSGLKAVAFDSEATAFDLKAVAFDLKSTDSDLKAAASDLEATAFDSKATASDLKATASDSKATAFGLKAAPHIYRNTHAIIPCGRFAPRTEKNILRTLRVSQGKKTGGK